MQSGHTASVMTPGGKTRLEREVEATTGQIKQLVYELYGLTGIRVLA